VRQNENRETKRTIASRHIRWLFHRLRGIRRSPVARVAVTGESAAVGVESRLQRCHVRVELS